MKILVFILNLGLTLTAQASSLDSGTPCAALLEADGILRSDTLLAAPLAPLIKPYANVQVTVGLGGGPLDEDPTVASVTHRALPLVPFPAAQEDRLITVLLRKDFADDPAGQKMGPGGLDQQYYHVREKKGPGGERHYGLFLDMDSAGPHKASDVLKLYIALAVAPYVEFVHIFESVSSEPAFVDHEHVSGSLAERKFQAFQAATSLGHFPEQAIQTYLPELVEVLRSAGTPFEFMPIKIRGYKDENPEAVLMKDADEFVLEYVFKVPSNLKEQMKNEVRH